MYPLHRGDDAEPLEPRDVVRVQMLGVLDAETEVAPGLALVLVGVLEQVQRLPVHQPGGLSGDYVGAQGSATFGVGVGGNVLVGGSANSIALQPLSVQGQVGISIAAGLESLELRPGR